MLVKVSTARNRSFLLVQSADHLTGLTGATPTVTLSKDGGAFAAAGGTVTEIANGVYKIALTTTDTNTKGDLFYHVTAASADACDFADQVVTDLPGDSVASVTGAVGSVTGAVGSVTAGVTVTTNNDKTGYSLTQTFPTNFSSLAITAGGAVTVGTNNDKTGYTLTVTPPTSAQIATAVWQDTTAGDFTTASSIGKSLYTSGNAPGAASGLALVGSNMGTVTSVSGAVGSVTGNVGGNVVGSVASVTGAVGSVTARVTANTDQINGTAQTARDLGLALPAAAPGAAGGVFIAGTNAPVTITGSGDALTITSTAANGRGLVVSGNGTGSGATVTGGATGPGLKLVGGGTSGDGLDITTTSGDGVSILPTAGSAIVATGNGTSKFGIIATGGTGGTSDGVKAVAGTGGVPIRGDITGNIHGTLDTLTTYTGNTPQTGDAFARLGAPAGASTSADIAAVKTDTGNISTQVVSTRAEPSSVPAATSTLGTKVDWLFALARNKRTTTATVDTLRNDADGATIGTSTISDDGTTFTKNKYV